jgi:hypothetical protein
MTTTTVTPAASSLATSTKFKAFALVMAASFPVIYIVCDIWNLPLFTFHPGTNRVAWGWEAARSGEGPAMYWYGWTATCLLASAFLGLVGMVLPEGVVRKIPLALAWLLPILAVPFLIYSLMPFWTK